LINQTKVAKFLFITRKTLRILTYPIVFVLNSVLFTGIGMGIVYFWIVQTLPDDATILDVKPQQPLRVYNPDHLLMGEYGAQRRDPIRYADTPPLLIKAFLAAEDSRFFEHSGVDMQSLGRAVLNLINTGELSQGGSTITMQLVRNLFLTPEKSFQRKLAELLLAMHLESKFSKEQIFELYQNRIFFGHQAYGVAAAAKIYYNTNVHDLSLAQMATLAGIPQAPSAHNPITRPDKAVARRAYVLGRMLTLGWITQAEHDAANVAAEDAHLTPVKIEVDAPYLAEMARREAHKLYGEQVYTSGLHLTTTVDIRLQSMAQWALNQTLLEYDQRHGYRGSEAKVDPTANQQALDEILVNYPSIQDVTAAIVLQVQPKVARIYLGNGEEQDLTLNAVAWAMPNQNSKNVALSMNTVLTPGDVIRVKIDKHGQLNLTQMPKVEGALVALSPTDGTIKALIGGFDFKRSQFNRAVDARRQPGSSFKPFVYAAALSKNWTPTSIINDSPLQIQDGRNVWRPRNIDNRYLGKITLRNALAQSRNLAAVQLLRSIGVKETRQFVTRFGFRLEQLPNGLSLALGSGEASPLQMAGAYASFANGGFRVAPRLIHSLQDYAGNPISLPVTNSERVLEPQVVTWMNDLLQEVIRSGTGKRALVLNRTDLAGKTGTSNGVRDAWFCGFNADLVVIAWMGFDDYSPLGDDEVGGHSALDLWITFMEKYFSTQQNKTAPNSVVDNSANLAFVGYEND
jgi:penicillin-binding protein 1A